MSAVPHLMSLADLSPKQINRLVQHAYNIKVACRPYVAPQSSKSAPLTPRTSYRSLTDKTVGLLFSKRSTRTRLATETAATMLGGRALFLGREDIQLGVNETVRDSARIIGGMCEGIVARVGDHSEIEELAKYSPVPVMNALSSLWHPTQTLANLLTLHEHAHLFDKSLTPPTKETHEEQSLNPLPPLTIAYVGDSANVLHDMLVTYPRLGHKMRIASPDKPQYRAPSAVWDRVKELKCDEDIWWGADPREAVKGADIVVSDTWVSMGQEAEYAQRVADFAGYQVTEALCAEGGANPEWKFMHCLPRKSHEVDDKVFYGPRSLAFQEADNRRWTTLAVFDLLFGKWDI
ncbi:ornithine carbamoyltransferase [Peniophora sp. CONT]|nr:ornithine carbamoyltransferase [Peniophora sp. CONT]